MVQRLAKGVLPPNTSLHKDAILAMSKGATVFINYLAHAANTASLSGGKRTIPPNAVIEALAELEFESFGPRVEAELKKFNEVQTGKRNEYRRKVKEGKRNGAKGDGGGEEEGEEEEEDEEEGRAKKRVRRDEGEEGMDEGDEGRERRESGAGDPSAQLQTDYREYEPEEPDEDEDDDDDAEGQEGENDASNFEPRPSDPQDGEEEEEEEGEEEGEEEDEEEEDDEDEYPDEGRRLSSVERESFERPGDDAGTPGSSADEALSEDESSD